MNVSSSRAGDTRNVLISHGFDWRIAESESTSSDVIAAAKAMDPTAWRQMVDQYSWLVFRWCRGANLTYEDAADVVQSVLLQVARYLPDFSKDGKQASFRRWLRSITSSKIADFRRVDVRQPRAEGGSDALSRIESLSSVLAENDSEEICLPSYAERLWDALEQVEEAVEERTWRPFWLTFVEGHTAAEAATLLGTNPHTIRLAKGRVLQRLRKIFAAQLPNPANNRTSTDSNSISA